MRVAKSELTNPLRLELRHSMLHEVVENMPFFARCTPELRHYIISIMKPQQFVPGDIICDRDEVPQHMYVLLSGSACLRAAEGGEKRRMCAKEWMGETMLLVLLGDLLQEQNQELGWDNPSAAAAASAADVSVHVRIEAVDYCNCFSISLLALRQALLEFPSNVSELRRFSVAYRPVWEARARAVGVGASCSSPSKLGRRLSKHQPPTWRAANSFIGGM